ncbi:MAG: TRAP transporter substrate-binding protein [Deltaproteobacteria bacterium]|nr:TRAP transporter substrate-binding protein [Deltaproteobacteria bacterium]
MKKQKKVLCIVGLICAGAFLFSSVALARPLELNFNLFIHAQHERTVHCHMPWIEKLVKESGGKLKITPYYSNSLTPMPEKFDSTVAGIADISEGIVFVNPGRFPMSEMMMLPELGLDTAQNAGNAWWHLYKTMPAMQKEYGGVKMLFLHTSPKMMIATVKKPIRKLADLKGLKIWTTGKTPVKTAKALGFTHVAMAPGEVYLALEKGVIDGCFADFEILVSRRFYEVSKYIVTNLYMNHTPFYMIMNQGVWDGLPADIKKVFEKNTGDWAVDFYGKIRDKQEKHAEEVAKEKGMQFTQVSPAEHAKAKKLVEPVKTNYAAELEAKGLPGKKALAELLNFPKK